MNVTDMRSFPKPLSIAVLLLFICSAICDAASPSKTTVKVGSTKPTPVVAPKPTPKPPPAVSKIPAQKPGATVKPPASVKVPPVLAPTTPRPTVTPQQVVPRSAEVPTPSNQRDIKQPAREFTHTPAMRAKVRDIFGAGGASTGPTRRRGDVILDDLTATKELDKASPKISEAVTKGKVFPKVEIDVSTSFTEGRQPDTSYTPPQGYIPVDPDLKPWDPTDMKVAAPRQAKGGKEVGLKWKKDKEEPFIKVEGASSTAFAKYDGVDGEAQDKDHTGWGDIQLMSDGEGKVIGDTGRADGKSEMIGDTGRAAVEEMLPEASKVEILPGTEMQQGDQPEYRRGDVFPKVELEASSETMFKFFKPEEGKVHLDGKGGDNPNINDL